ncbi:MAG: glycosyltransferase [Desulfuromonadaceae bacterium]|nr:glycosyltransferase [Desulfuromonadaceae bacterium]
MDDIQISFIVPLYNEEKTIASCLDSIIAEMHVTDEIIVVDNGSTDKSANIVSAYQSITLLERPRVTVAAVRNFGAKMAKGNVLAFIDSDCIVCIDWRKQLVQTLKVRSVAASGSKYCLPESACWIEKVWYSQRNKTAGKAKYINSGNLAIRKDVFLRVGGFDETLITGEDSELCWRLSHTDNIVFENPDIKAIHLGNPKNLWRFYKQQRWHSLGMFGTFKVSCFDKPVMMTIAFAFCLLFSLLTAFYNENMFDLNSQVFAVMLILSIPIITTFYRCFQFRNFLYFPQLVLLYLVYFVARIDALLRICYTHIEKGNRKLVRT